MLGKTVSMFPIPVGENNSQLVMDFVARCKSAGCDFCPSDISASESSSMFFYHVPATGGLRFTLPISFAIDALVSSKDNELLSKLLESDIAPLPIRSYIAGASDLEVAEQSSTTFFYSDSQTAYGAHTRLGNHPASPALRTVTILRDPLKRLSGVLRKIWNLNGQDLMKATTAIVSIDSFSANPITRIFSGKISGGVELQDSDICDVLDALKSIDYCCHQENFSPVRLLQQQFLSSNRLPNLVVPSVINGCSSEPPDHVMQEMLRVARDAGCNKWDSVVYSEFIKSTPVDLEPATFSISSLHPLTYLLELNNVWPNKVSISPGSRLVPTIDVLLGKVPLLARVES